jgi:hypothetical protein
LAELRGGFEALGDTILQGVGGNQRLVFILKGVMGL